MRMDGLSVFDWRFVSLVLLSFFVIMIFGFLNSVQMSDSSGTEIREMEVSLPFESVVSEKYSRDGQNISPKISYGGVPDEAESIAIVLEDIDSPGASKRTHWLVWNLPVNGSVSERMPEKESLNSLGASQGRNDFNNIGYTGPDSNVRTHTYLLTVYALESELDLNPASSKQEFNSAIKGDVVGMAEKEFYY